MARLLVVHHTPSPALQEVLERVVGGAQDDAVHGVEVVLRPALTASPVDVLEADGYLLGTPANLGYLSGALKHFFDTIYYPCLQATRGRPFGAWVQGNNDLAGALRALDAITTGLGWERVAPTLQITGPLDPALREACYELGAVLAVTVAPDC